MKRALFAMVLGLGVGMMGCAAGVDDPVPQTPAPVEQTDPPPQTLSAELPNVANPLLAGAGGNGGISQVPAKQRPQLAGPLPGQH